VAVTILGIDPGLANTGWGVVEHRGATLRCIAYGCITTTTANSISSRLAHIHTEVRAVIERYHPAECAIESVFFGANTKSAFATGQARGAALVAVAGHCAVVGDYSPVQIKSVVAGSGSAEKSQVQYMVRAVLELDHEPSPDHAADALAAAITHARLRTYAARERAATGEHLEISGATG
jgi:crossover junction endodeoxyribonuclease RuvC